MVSSNLFPHPCHYCAAGAGFGFETTRALACTKRMTYVARFDLVIWQYCAVRDDDGGKLHQLDP